MSIISYSNYWTRSLSLSLTYALCTPCHTYTITSCLIKALEQRFFRNQQRTATILNDQYFIFWILKLLDIPTPEINKEYWVLINVCPFWSWLRGYAKNFTSITGTSKASATQQAFEILICRSSVHWNLNWASQDFISKKQIKVPLN